MSGKINGFIEPADHALMVEVHRTLITTILPE